MKKLLLAVLAISAIIFSSCGAADRTLDGPPKYDVNGNKVGGDDLYDEEVLKINNIKKLIKNDTSSTSTKVDSLPGYIINESNKYLNVMIYMSDEKNTEVQPALLAPHTWMQIKLLPQFGYYAEFDGGLGSHKFDVVPWKTAPTTIPGVPAGGFFYLHKINKGFYF